jgi:hypothetical protein
LNFALEPEGKPSDLSRLDFIMRLWLRSIQIVVTLSETIGKTGMSSNRI